MSNATLKEQLQALSLTPTATAVEGNPKKVKKPAQTMEKSKKKPAWLEQAQYGVELLKAHFPACFKENKEIKPLKIGIKQDLAKHLSSKENIVIGDKACMVNSLAYYVNSLAYHKSVVVGVARIDLEGQPAGEVTADEAQYSAEYRKSRLQQKEKSKVSV